MVETLCFSLLHFHFHASVMLQTFGRPSRKQGYRNCFVKL